MKILIILLIIVIFLIITKDTFGSLLVNNYTLNIPGFGDETYLLPLSDLESDNIKLNDEQYLVFAKYMNVPKIANFMSDNSQISSDKMGNLVGLSTKGVPGIISGKTISYNQAVGINSGTATGIAQNNPPTNLQINRSKTIFSVVSSLVKMYCSDPKANYSDQNSSKKYITNCKIGDIIVDLERTYYIISGNTLSQDPISLDYPTYVAIWYALHNRRIILLNRLDTYKNL